MNSKLSSGSWHFRLATYYGPMHEWLIIRDGTDICEYTKAVLAGVRNVALIIALISAYGVSWIHFFARMLAGWPEVDEFYKFLSAASPAATGAITLFVAGAFTVDKLNDWRYERAKRIQAEPVKEPGFIKQAYISFRDKYCMKLSFTDTDSVSS